MQPTKRIPPKGQAYCEQCSKLVLDWTIQTVLIDGRFYDICRACYYKLKSEDSSNAASKT